MSISIVFSFFSLLLHIIYASQHCPISFCKLDNVPIRFPFLLQGYQPQGCGYPGFEITCNDQNATILKIPNWGPFLVRSINYATQQIQLYDPHNCLLKRLLTFNLSGSPFVAASYQNYTILSCPVQVMKFRISVIECLSNSTTSVIATSSGSLLSQLSASCEIITVLSVPVSWPNVFEKGVSNAFDNDLQLSWYNPDCEQCEGSGGICGFDGNSSQEIGCIYPSYAGQSTNGLHILKIICLSIILPSLIFAVCITIFVYTIDRSARGSRHNSTQRIMTRTAISPQPTTEMSTGLDESTIESYKKVVLGESKRLPSGPNDGSCAICLSEYRGKDILRFIPECKHCFHVDCIDEWLRMNGSCPVCRKSPSNVAREQNTLTTQS